MARQEHHEHGLQSPEEITAESPFTLPGFFAVLADGQLLGAVCADCGTVLIPPRPACYACGSRDVHIEEQPRSGEIVSYTEVHKPAPAFADQAPFTVAVVELDSEARLTGRVSTPYDEVDIGMPVQLSVREPTDNEKEAALTHEKEWPIHIFDPA
jgi:uncharacterized OB-fold protein